MSIQGVWQKSFGFLGSKPIVVEPSAGGLTSDAGWLPLRQFDEAFGLTRQFAGVLEDPRYQPFVDHSLAEMVRMRIYGILADYEDQNDHDALRSGVQVGGRPLAGRRRSRQPADVVAI